LFLSDPNVQFKSLQGVPQPNGTNLFLQSSVGLEPLHPCWCEGCRAPKTVTCSVLFCFGWFNLPLFISHIYSLLIALPLLPNCLWMGGCPPFSTCISLIVAWGRGV
jgi:hypothetical protein